MQKGETLTREKYVACVQSVAERLRKDGFFSDKAAAWYAEQAKKDDIEPKAAR